MSKIVEAITTQAGKPSVAWHYYRWDRDHDEFRLELQGQVDGKNVTKFVTVTADMIEEMLDELVQRYIFIGSHCSKE